MNAALSRGFRVLCGRFLGTSLAAFFRVGTTLGVGGGISHGCTSSQKYFDGWKRVRKESEDA